MGLGQRSSETVPSSLTTDDLKRWDEDGFLIVPNALSQSHVEDLRRETQHLLESFSIEE